MFFCFILTSLLVSFISGAAASSRYVVHLKDPSTLSQLLDQDDQVVTQNHIRASVVNTITIGEEFQAIIADLEEETLERVKLNPLVDDVLEDNKVKIFECFDQGLETFTTVKHRLNSEKDIKIGVDQEKMEPENQKDLTKYNLDQFQNRETEHFARKFNDGNVERISTSIPNEPKSTSLVRYKVQSDAPRHLARLSSYESLFTKQPPYEYFYRSSGSGVTAYVLDTGIDIGHPDFEGRAKRGANLVPEEGEGDRNGHGTHVAGALGSKTYGVAKEVEIVDIKVLDRTGSGNLSAILQGIEWAVNDRRSRGVKALANLSLGTFANKIFDDAVNAALNSGLVLVVAAGNSNFDASYFSPARASGSLTIGALDDRSDTIAVFSNYGDKIATFASGVNVESLNKDNYDEVLSLSGTSMATPVVAGLVAMLLEDNTDPKEIKNRIIENSVQDIISLNISSLSKFKYRTTPNRVAFNGITTLDKDNYFITNIKPSFNGQDFSLIKYIDHLNDIESNNEQSSAG
ncbi:hypothetical protein WICMUC_003641 [Wickerhamomyces mucosus]|uniref:Peptidase S8/S53 domain-containing protein n=1 Tax=Wickerhamomyces mucosus TaxID=1378264 RepID=A0A9P8TCC3_9ASCO|nr:hypothetical protein WICMUC_003641 [Wickerhamomyces mucosus]